MTPGAGRVGLRPCRRRGALALASTTGALLLGTSGAAAAPIPAADDAAEPVPPVARSIDPRPSTRSDLSAWELGGFAAQPGGPDSPKGADARPCFHPHWVTVAAENHVWRLHARTCPDWAPDGRIPVFARRAAESRVIGHLDARREAWYHCQDVGAAFHLRDAVTRWWAATRTPEGQSGWVAQVYFRGAAPGAADGGLEFCGNAANRAPHRVAPAPIALPLPVGPAGAPAVTSESGT